MDGPPRRDAVVLGIDLGSSSAKAVLLDDTGSVVARAQVAQRIARPEAGAAEQSAGSWWTAVRDLVDATWGSSSDRARTSVAAVCVSGHYPTLLLADETGGELGPALLYADTRCDAFVEEAARLGGEHLTGDEWLPKLLWLAHERPELLERTRMLFDPHDHVAYRLTGRRGLDHRSARRSGGLFDPHHLAWRDDVAATLGLDPAGLPPLRNAGEILGTVTANASREVGLPAGTPVVVGLGDTPAELIGAGVVRPADVLLYYGTTTSADVCTHDFSAYLSDPTPIADWAPYREVAYAVLGPALSWVAGGIDPGERTGSDSPQLPDLDRAAERIVPTLEVPYVIPYFLAHARPGDPVRRPAIVGLDADHSRADLHRAILESYGFSIRAGLEGAGWDLDGLRFVASGGGARSAFWRQLTSDVIGAEQTWSAAADASLGSAILAGRAAWGWPSLDVGAAASRTASSRTRPDPARSAIEDARYQRWLAIRDALTTL